MQFTGIKVHCFSLVAMIRQLLRTRQMTWEMAKREITDRYAGQFLGTFWSIGHPLFLMAVYVFVFTFVFKMKVGGTQEMPLDYTVYLLAGLVPWMAFAESMSKNSSVIAANAGLVKQVVFPLEVLPIKGVIASLMTQVIASVLLMLYVLLSSGTIPWTYALLPALWLIQGLAMIGVGFILAALSPYVRDVKDFVQLFCTAGMYFMPIAYLPQWVPGPIRPLLYLNPFSYLCWCYQDLCYYGRFEHPWSFPILCILSTLFFYGGFRLFRTLQVYFGNVL